METTIEKVALRETDGAINLADGTTERRRITIIREGWGSSGYYSRELLERDGPAAFPVGTHMYLDHPTRTEERDRPERSIRDLAAKIVSTPRMEGSELVAEAEIFPMFRPVIAALADDIGVSIRAAGERQLGEAEGRKGPIVTAIHAERSNSVDFVTRAGAGGRVGDLVESARHLHETANSEQRDALQRALTDRFKSADTHPFLLDFDLDAGWVVFEARLANEYAKWQVAVEPDGDNFVIVGDPVEVRAVTRYVPVADVDTDESETSRKRQTNPAPDGVKESSMENKDSAIALAEATRQVEELTAQLAEANRDLERANDKIKTIEARNIVAAKVNEAAADLPAKARERAIESALAGELPATDDGLDSEALAARAVEAVKAEREYLAEATGSPVRDLGGSTVNATNNADIRESLFEQFKARGLSDEAARAAAERR